MRYARGTYAFGFCDRCQFRAPLNELKYQVIAARLTNLRVCSECLDEDNPQIFLGQISSGSVNPPVVNAITTEGGVPLLTEGGLTITI